MTIFNFGYFQANFLNWSKNKNISIVWILRSKSSDWASVVCCSSHLQFLSCANKLRKCYNQQLIGSSSLFLLFAVAVFLWFILSWRGQFPSLRGNSYSVIIPHLCSELTKQWNLVIKYKAVRCWNVVYRVSKCEMLDFFHFHFLKTFYQMLELFINFQKRLLDYLIYPKVEVIFCHFF